MAHYNKIGLLVLNEDHTQMMVLNERINHEDHGLGNVYKMIGGTINPNEPDIDCLIREVQEEISCTLDLDTLHYIGEYIAPAVGWTDRDVSIKLYHGSLIGTPCLSGDDSDIIDIMWIKPDQTLPQLQANTILKDYILPDLLSRNIINI